MLPTLSRRPAAWSTRWRSSAALPAAIACAFAAIAIAQSSPAALAQRSASSANVAATASRPAFVSRPARSWRTCARSRGSIKSLAMASASAMASGCSAARPSMNRPRVLMQSAWARAVGCVGARQAQRAVDPVDCVRVAVPHHPVEAERRSIEQARVRRRRRSTAQPSAAWRLSISASRWARCCLRSGPHNARSVPWHCSDRQEIAEVTLAHSIRFSGGREALGCVGADRFQHPQPRRRMRVLSAHEQALGDKPFKRVEIGGRDRLSRLHRGAAREDREARETRLLRVAEQLVAPVDGRAQRLLAGGRVASPCAECAKHGMQPLGDLAGREQTAAGRRQLDRER